MNLKEIVSITGKPGLYKVVAQTQKGLIVEALDEKKSRIPVTANNQVALLDEITIYTDAEENLPLAEVFENIKKYAENNSLPGPKDDSVKLKSFFREIAPNYDAERVYVSDMKKVIKWFEVLSSHNIISE